jgi:hypothetical protein
MSEGLPEIIIDPPSTHGVRALASGERATSTSCLDGIKRKLIALKKKVTGAEAGLVIGQPADPRPAKRAELEGADQLTLDFLRDPGYVLGAHVYAMTTSANFELVALTKVAQLLEGPGAPDQYLVTQSSNATVRFYAKHSRYKGARELHVEAAREEGDPKVYLLPWDSSKLTYCKLAEDAALVLTGPLDGCSVFVVEAEDGKDTYLFHVNANGAGPDEYIAAQRAKLGAALDRLWPDSGKRRLTHRLDYTGYRPLSADMRVEAFVYGTRSGSGVWDFAYYVVDVDTAGNSERRSGMPAPLPRE